MKSKINYFGHTDFSFHVQRYNEGEITYEMLLNESYKIHSSCLKGKHFSDIAGETETFVNEIRNPSLYDFTLDLLTVIEKKDIAIIVISGGPCLPFHSYKNIFPIHQVYATEIEVSGMGVFTGNVLSTHGHFIEKLSITRKLQQLYDISLAFGNNYTDLPMLKYAEHGFLKLNPITSYSIPNDAKTNIRELNSDTIKYISKIL